MTTQLDLAFRAVSGSVWDLTHVILDLCKVMEANHLRLPVDIVPRLEKIHTRVSDINKDLDSHREKDVKNEGTGGSQESHTTDGA